MVKDLSLQQLWDSAPWGESIFHAADIPHRDETVRSYLEHAIAPGTVLARAVRLRMHGEIKLKRWLPFKAEEVIVWDRGFIWSATVRMFAMPIRGSDRIVDGEGSMQWKLLDIIPVMTASGPDITRSAAGRVAAGIVWLPSVLCGDEVSWTTSNSSHLHARFTAHGETAKLELVVGNKGQLKTLTLPRWGNPDGADFHYVNFGGIVAEEKTMDGYTIPTHLRAGWYFGSDRFESEGEFFRCIIDNATYR